MQTKTRLEISEAKYIRSSHRKHNEKKRVHKTQRIVSTAVVILCCAFLILGGIQVVSANTSAFQITVDGEGLATLTSEKEAKAAIARYLEDQSALLGFGVVCGDNVKIERISSRDAVYSSTKDAASALTGGVSVLAKAVAVCVNGQPIMYVADEETARQALERSKAQYGVRGERGVESVDVLEQVGVIASNVPPEQVISVDEAANMLIYGSAQVEYHFVETEGETFDYIANRYALAVDDIKAANPTADSTNLAVGEAIVLARVQPLISVQVKRMVVAREEMPFDTEQRDNYQIARGETKIVVEGAPGEAEVTTEIIERNGLAVAQNRVSAVILQEPVTQVEDRGAKMVIASRSGVGNPGNGILGWPYGGNISSRFGSRSLGYHSGLDISGPKGDPVIAAEAGTVIWADWEGAYGNLIKIDHGGGLVTYYGHLSAYAVSAGDVVTRGQMIGSVGTTGRVTGPHVHFEVRYQGSCYDPMQFLEPRQ